MERLNDGKPLIEARGLSKRFCRDYQKSLIYGLFDVAGEIFRVRPPATRLRPAEFWALTNINFTLNRGDAIGIVGRNGSGKTTLLRVLAGTIKPTTGSVTRRGRIAPMLALGAGFNPVLSGRENIFVNMAILGLKRDQIKRRFDEVVAFSGIEESLDAPVQNYSSGMVARLGFACAVHTAPDIMLVDEVLAVGDWFFQEKCREKIQSMRNEGTAFVIINHSPQMIVDSCQNAIYLSSGRCVAAGDAKEVVRKYGEDIWRDSTPPSGGGAVTGETGLEGRHPHRVSCEWSGEVPGPLVSGRMAVANIRVSTPEPLHKVNLLVRVEPSVEQDRPVWKNGQAGDASAASILIASSYTDGLWISELPEGATWVELRFEPLCLTAGHYRFLLWSYAHVADLDDQQVAFTTGYFEVESRETLQGSNYHQPRRWCLQPEASKPGAPDKGRPMECMAPPKP
ncbi:MAG: ABC transporter ATP-binding protein [Terrimicrobiaceae bacterium]|nr:ABC transporter ATP-binding protein [Terrimicrobiaceae bacterium]